MEGFLTEGLNLLPRLTRAGAFIARCVRFNPESGYHSNHTNRGGAVALDVAMYDTYRGSEDMNRWDDLGDYTDRSA